MKKFINPVPAEWQALKPGNAFVIVSEPAVLSVTDGKGPFPIESPIDEIVSIKEEKGVAEWLLLTLKSASGVVLIAKLSGEKVSVNLMRQSALLLPATRAELVASETLFLFSPPENVDAWQAADVAKRQAMASRLTFAGYFERGALTGAGEEWKYIQKSDREFYGKATTRPYRPDARAAISEYNAEIANVPDPELIIVEQDYGSDATVTLYTGCPVSCDEIFVS